jgi:hypothetical protein
MKHLMAAVLIFMITTSAFSDEYDCDVPCKTMSYKDVTISGIRLFNSTFKDAYKIFGKAKAYKPMENRDSYICYTSADKTDQTAIVFGSYNDIDTVELYKYKSQVLPQVKCSASSMVNKNIRFDSGLKLGMTINEFNKINNNGNNTIYRSLYEISTFDCCSVEAKECKGIIRTHFTTRLLEDRIYYIKADHTEYCE